jgi:hypothetical protein
MKELAKNVYMIIPMFFHDISGERCQYQDECLEDEDCGRHGKCIDVEATSAPRKQCFCQAGFFGAGCAEGQQKLI